MVTIQVGSEGVGAEVGAEAEAAAAKAVTGAEADGGCWSSMGLWLVLMQRQLHGAEAIAGAVAEVGGLRL